MEFSVIVPVYKVEAYIRCCVESILAQTFRDFELILVDDGSPDGSGAICDGFAAADPRVSVIHQENSGVVAARKAGLDRAGAEYVCFVDGDDYVAPDWLETVERHAAENGRPDMIISGLTEDYGDRRMEVPNPLEPGLYDKTRLEREIYPYMLYDRRKPFFDQLLPGYLHAKVGKRTLYTEHYISDPRIKLYEDVAMIYECMLFSSSIVFGAECPYYYRMRADSMVGRYKPEHFRQNRLCLDYLREHLGRCAPAMDEQIDAFIAAKTMRAIVYEFAHGHTYRAAVRHVRTELKNTRIMKDVSLAALPVRFRMYGALLKYGFCGTAVFIAKALGWE